MKTSGYYLAIICGLFHRIACHEYRFSAPKTPSGGCFTSFPPQPALNAIVSGMNLAPICNHILCRSFGCCLNQKWRLRDCKVNSPVFVSPRSFATLLWTINPPLFSAAVLVPFRTNRWALAHPAAAAAVAKRGGLWKNRPTT